LENLNGFLEFLHYFAPGRSRAMPKCHDNETVQEL